jgi:hypothetical protein
LGPASAIGLKLAVGGAGGALQENTIINVVTNNEYFF